MTGLILTADEVLTTTRSVRKRLDLNRAVDLSIVYECIAMALQAPTAANRQTWKWLVVSDPALRVSIAEEYGHLYDGLMGPRSDESGTTPDDLMRASTDYLRDHLHEVPIHVILCRQGRPPLEPAPSAQVNYWASVLPAGWSFMLALRTRGLGSAFTTLHLRSERAIADLLGIPFEDYAQVALFPVAYTVGTDFRPAHRQSVQDVVYINGWGSRASGEPA